MASARRLFEPVPAQSGDRSPSLADGGSRLKPAWDGTRGGPPHRKRSGQKLMGEWSHVPVHPVLPAEDPAAALLLHRINGRISDVRARSASPYRMMAWWMTGSAFLISLSWSNGMRDAVPESLTI